MEKVLGIGADAIELLHQRSGGATTKGDPVRIVRGKYAGQRGTLAGLEPLGLDWRRPRRPRHRMPIEQFYPIELIDGRRVLVSERNYAEDWIDWRGIERGKDLFVTGLQNQALRVPPVFVEPLDEMEGGGDGAGASVVDDLAVDDDNTRITIE